MKFRNILFIVAVFFITGLRAQNFKWTKQIGGTSDEMGEAATVDASGNVYTTGYFNGTTDFDPGPGVYNLTSVNFDDVFILKLDSSGNFLWVRQIQAPFGVEVRRLITNASGDVFLTAILIDSVNFDPGISNLTLEPPSGNSSSAVAKWTSSGNFVWAKQFGGGSQAAVVDACDMFFDNAGNIFVAAGFDKVVDFDPGPGTYTMTPTTLNRADVCVTKLDPSGNFVWAKHFGGSLDDCAKAVDVDASGNIITTGFFEGTADMDPGPGVFNLTAAGSQDQFISKLDANGNFVWAVRCGGPVGSANGTSVRTDAAGGIVTSGAFQGTVDFDPGPSSYTLASVGIDDVFITKLDASGNFMWANSFGHPYMDGVLDLALDGSGNVYTTGYFGGTVDFDSGPGTYTLSSPCGQNIFVHCLNASGNFLWVDQVAGCNSSTGSGIITDIYGNVYSCGYFSGLGDFDPGPATYNLVCAGGWDMYISKLSSFCTVPSSPLNATSAANSYLCGSASTTLSVNGFGAINWYNSPTSTTVIASGSVYTTPVLPVGTYTYYADAITCAMSATRTAITVTVNALPSVSVTVSSSITCSSPAPGPAVNLTGNPSGGVYSGPYVSGGVFNSSLTIIPGGTYTVSYTYTDAVTGCSAMASTTIVAASCTGVNELGASSDRIVVYPNPTKENFNVQINSDLKNGTISITNALGEKIMEQQIRQGMNEIECQELAPGIYLYVISEANVPLDKGRIVIE